MMLQTSTHTTLQKRLFPTASEKANTSAKPMHWLLAFAVAVAGLLCPAAAVGQTHGIDVSHHHEYINWKKVATNKNIKFVYIKATEGAAGPARHDPHYRRNIEGAKAAGLKVGSYHVYSSKSTAYEQFNNFKSVVKKSEQDLVPVLDIEERHSRGLYMTRVDKILELMEKHYGKKPMIYMSEKVYWEHFAGKKYKDYPMFIANYARTPRCRYTIWQRSQTGRVSGISGHVDLSCFHAKSSIKDIAIR